MCRLNLFILILLLHFSGIEAQKLLPHHQNLFLSALGSFGYIAPHHESIRYFTKDYTRAFQIEAGWKTAGAKAWHHQHNFPHIGLGYYTSGLSNDEVFGKAHAAYGFVESAGRNQWRRLWLSQKFSVGLSYLSEKYDLRENPYNLAIGSHLNVYLAYQAGFNVKITGNSSLYTGVSFTHYSNGKIKEPNKGLNNVTLTMGITQKFRTRSDQEAIPAKQLNNNDVNRWTTMVAVGWKQISRRIPKHFFVSSLSVNYTVLSKARLKIGVGMDVFYDSSTKRHREFDNQEMAGNQEYFRSGIHISYAYVIGRTSFIVQPGAYIFNPYNKYGDGYNRLAMQYAFSNNILAQVAVKAHFPAKADFIEWGIGYSF